MVWAKFRWRSPVARYSMRRFSLDRNGQYDRNRSAAARNLRAPPRQVGTDDQTGVQQSLRPKHIVVAWTLSQSIHFFTVSTTSGFFSSGLGTTRGAKDFLDPKPTWVLPKCAENSCLPSGNSVVGIISVMGTKQHKTYCAACGKTTNHVTVYQKAADGRLLVATVQCFEHSDLRH